MAKTPKKPATRGAKPASAKKPGAGKTPANAKNPKPPSVKRPTKEKEARLEAEREAYYRANQERIDDALGKCLRHFGDDEPDIVRAVGRMLFDRYGRNRMQIPKVKAPGPSVG